MQLAAAEAEHKGVIAQLEDLQAELSAVRTAHADAVAQQAASAEGADLVARDLVGQLTKQSESLRGELDGARAGLLDTQRWLEEAVATAGLAGDAHAARERELEVELERVRTAAKSAQAPATTRCGHGRGPTAFFTAPPCPVCPSRSPLTSFTVPLWPTRPSFPRPSSLSSFTVTRWATPSQFAPAEPQCPPDRKSVV